MIENIKTNGNIWLIFFSVLLILGTTYVFQMDLPEQKAISRQQEFLVQIQKTAKIISPPGKVNQIQNIGLLEELTSRQLSDKELLELAISSSQANTTEASKGIFQCNP